MRYGSLEDNDKEFQKWNHKWSEYVWFLSNHYTIKPDVKIRETLWATKRFANHFKTMLDLHPNEKFFLSNEILISGTIVDKSCWKSNNFVNLACIKLHRPEEIRQYYEISFEDVMFILHQSYKMVVDNNLKFSRAKNPAEVYAFSKKENMYFEKNNKYDYGLTIYNIHSKLLL